MHPENTDRPLVSIVTIVYNGGAFLERTMQSVLSQTYSNYEYIVVDGASSDGSLEIIRKYSSKLSAWTSEKDKGIYDAMNKGAQLAKGKWLNYMNCGDTFADDKVLEVFNAVPREVDVVYGRAIIEYPGFATDYPLAPIDKMWKKMPFCHQATFVRTALLKDQPFDLRYRLSGDFDWLYRGYLAGYRFRFIDRLVCRFNNAEGASVSNALKSTKERRNSVLSHNYSFKTWLYYLVLVNYVRFGLAIKTLIGKRTTEWVTRFLRT